MVLGGVWVPVTLLASSAQTLRSAMQRDLIGAVGAVGAAQVIATALMPAAMRTESFVAAVAYSKTEAAQIALFGLIALNDPPTAALIAAIALATTSSSPGSSSGRRNQTWREMIR
jgi:hypothetical protein